MRYSLITLILLIFSINTWAQNACIDGELITTDPTTYYTLSTQGNAPAGPDYGCLPENPIAPNFYTLRIDNPGSLDIKITPSSSLNFGVICYGPFYNLPETCLEDLTAAKTVDCVDNSSDGILSIPSGNQGEYYIIFLSNYTQQAATVIFTKNNTGGGTTDPNVLKSWPTITCPSNIPVLDLGLSCQVNLPNYASMAAVTDPVFNNSQLTITQSPAIGSSITADTEVTLKVQNPDGNQDFCSFLVTVTETIPPTLTPLPLQTVYINDQGKVSLPDFTLKTTITDQCDDSPSIVQTPPVGNLPDFLNYTMAKIKATDIYGNSDSTSFELEYVDTISPTITCPGTQNLYIVDTCQAFIPDYSSLVTANDNYSTVTISQLPAINTIVTIGDLTMRMTATDTSGNSKSCSFLVMVIDSISPTLKTVPSQTLFIDHAGNVDMRDYRPLAEAKDNCDPDPSVIQIPEAGIFSNYSDYPFAKIFAYDNFNNVASTSFMMTYLDTISPTIICPVADPVFVGTNCRVSIIDYSPYAIVMDNVSTAITVTQEPVPGTLLPPGDQTIRLTAKDESGNTKSCSFQLEVKDNIPPSLSAVLPQVLFIKSDGKVDMPDYTPLAQVTDHCDENPAVGQIPPPGVLSNYVDYPKIKIIALDKYGNSDSILFNITYLDTISPTITCPEDQELFFDLTCSAFLPDYRSLVIVIDSTSSDIELTQTPEAGTEVFLGPNLVTFTATDESNNSSSCSINVEVDDNIPPILQPIPAQTLYLDDVGLVEVSDYRALANVIDYCDENPLVLQIPEPGTFINPNDYPYFKVKASDFAGNTDSTLFAINYFDTINPVIVCPPTQTIYVNADCATVIPDLIPLVEITDNASPIEYVFQIPEAGTPVAIGVYMIRITAIDTANNSATCDFDLVVSDSIPPTLKPIDDQFLYFDENGLINMPNYIPLAEITDQCDDSPFAFQIPDPGILSDYYDYPIIKIIAVDDFANTDSIQFNMTYIDTISPTIVCPETQELFVDENCEAYLPDYTTLAEVTDNISPIVSVTQLPPANTKVEVAGYSITIRAEDEAGNSKSCSFFVNVLDNLPPILQPIEDQILYIDELGQITMPNYIPWANVMDYCDTDPLVVQFPPMGLLPNFEDYPTVEIVATDSYQNQSSIEFGVTYLDTISPILSCPANQTLYKDENCNVLVPDYSNLVFVEDNYDPNPTLVQIPTAGTFVDIDAFSITFVATDFSDNSTSCTFDVATIDTISPTIVCLGPQVFDVDENCVVILPNYAETLDISDNCDPNPIITQTPAAGTNLSIGLYNVVILVRDNKNNFATCSFEVLVEDNTPPVITQGMGDHNIYTDPGGCYGILPDYTGFVEATDICDLELTYTQIPSPGTLLEGPDNLVTIEVSDTQGNIALNTFLITVVDNIPPTIFCPEEPLVVEVGENCEALLPDYLGIIEVIDNCDPDPYLVQEPVPGMPFTGEIEVTVIALDDQGNENSCSFIVVAEDNTPPMIPQLETQYVEAVENCEAPLPDFTLIIDIVDNCDNDPTVYQIPDPGSTLAGSTLVTIIATDLEGNTAQIEFTAEIIDDIPPTFECDDDIISCEPIVNFEEPLAFDNCEIVEISQTQGLPSGSEFPIGTTEIVFTAIDQAGNVGTCAFIVEVLSKPLVILQPYEDPDFCLDGEPVLLPDGFPEGGVYEGNGVVGEYFDPAIAGIGIHLITYTYTADNGCANSDEIEVEVDICTSLNDIGNEHFSVFPNPFTDKVNMRLSNSVMDQVRVMNYSGKIIMTEDLDHETYTMDFSNLAAGVYFIHIQSMSGKHFYQKVVKY